MKRICDLFKKDVLLGIKDVFILMELGFAVFIVLLLIFVIPKDIRVEGHVYIYDPTTLVKDFVHSTAESAEAARRLGEYYVDSRQEVIEGMKKDESANGLIITENNAGTYNVEMLIQPYTSESVARYVEIDLEDLFSILKPSKGVYPPSKGVYPADVYESVRIIPMKVGLRDELPFNQRILPPILLMMVGVVGLFAMVSLVSQERTEATIRAFRISPASLWEFLMSKHLMLLGVSFFSFSILYIPIIGFSGYFESLLIIMLTVLMGSSIGVILGGIFDNAMAAILWVILLMMVFSLPVISLFAPIFSPDWLKLIPSYHTLFGLDAAMFPDNNSHLIWQGAGVLAAIDAVLLFLSGFIFTHLIRKEA